MDKLEIKARAKINLALAIKYKREDGFHELESIFQEVDFADHLTIGKSDSVHFATNSTLVPGDDKNICVRAARQMVSRYNMPGLDMFLDKKIPAGAGLGGGSSDAAAVMIGSLRLYGIDPDPEELVIQAAELGSDVPFFLSGGTAYVTGRGEKLRNIRLTSEYQVLLVFPGIVISTMWAYKNLNLGLTKNVHSPKFTGFKFYDLRISEFASEFYNDFETMVFSVYPELKQIKQKIYDTGGVFASLSGSGSTVFGIYESGDKIGKALVEIGKQYKCCITSPVSYDSRWK